MSNKLEENFILSEEQCKSQKFLLMQMSRIKYLLCLRESVKCKRKACRNSWTYFNDMQYCLNEEKSCCDEYLKFLEIAKLIDCPQKKHYNNNSIN